MIDNAVKVTDKGSVEVEVAVARQRDQSQLRVVVTDTGAGMGRNQFGALFEPLQSETGADAGRASARTLSLPLCRAVCRLMGGDITGSSKLRVGTKMTIELPLSDTG